MKFSKKNRQKIVCINIKSPFPSLQQSDGIGTGTVLLVKQNIPINHSPPPQFESKTNQYRYHLTRFIGGFKQRGGAPRAPLSLRTMFFNCMLCGRCPLQWLLDPLLKINMDPCLIKSLTMNYHPKPRFTKILLSNFNLPTFHFTLN